jgi:(1->4)-alpha-D-glucan 1-alpha-D-glucosylmutase
MPDEERPLPSSALDALCCAYGVAGEYSDIWGNVHRASDRTRCAVLEALDVVHRGEDLQSALAAHERQTWERVVPPVAVFRIDAAPYRMRFRFHVALMRETYCWRFELESGEVRTGEFRPEQLETLRRHTIGAQAYCEVAFNWNERLPCGYHCYKLNGPGLPADLSATVVVGPQCCYVPPALEEGGRVWGAAVQLYSLRSQRDWGMGDLTDLRTLIAHWGRRGAGVIGLNPLHALFPHNAAHASPYSPSSRLFLDVLYIDVVAVPEALEATDVLATIGSESFQNALRSAREGDLVDYPAVAKLKFPLLERLYRHFRLRHLVPKTARGKAFRRFQEAGGLRLHQHTLFEALQEYFHRADPNVWGWPVWPAAYRRPDAPEVLAFARANAERIEFYQYLQWQAAQQLERAQADAQSLGMGVGIYLDLAISIDRGGAESWANQRLYAVGASVGAPPDEVNLLGQNWGLPPLRPNELAASRYEPFIATLRANMRYCGALRIDHVMGLYRLYWIPPGASAAEGAYVHYPFEDLLTILALESVRNECMVIGEDLGTVPDEVRAGLQATRVMSYRVLYFERDAAGEYKRPEDYPVDALVAASTHDLATLAGYWEGHDLDVRRSLDLFPSEQVRLDYVARRSADIERLQAALEREGLLRERRTGGVRPAAPPAALDRPETDAGARNVPPRPSTLEPAMAEAIHAYLARTPSRLFVVQLEDVLGVKEQANLPGTVEEQPNWRRRLPLTLEEIERDERFIATARTLADLRPRMDAPCGS